MKEAYLIFLVVASASTLSIIDHEWEAFKIKFNKRYDSKEDLQRRKIFNENKIMIEEHNKKFEEGKVTFTMGVNKFADMFSEEMNLLRGYKHNEDSQAGGLLYKSEVGVTYPDTVDWREHGYVTPVKDQGHCGSCWAFSATGALEGQNFARNGTLFSLSEQNLIDCIFFEGCFLGGRPEVAFNYVKRNHGIDTEETYPYNPHHSHFCKYDDSNKGGTCSGYTSLEKGSEDTLLAATATVGPISVAIDASSSSFSYYESGVYYEPKCSSRRLDHAVLVVGYGNFNGSDYWLVKNSWGVEWGDEGYIMMSRNKDNNCGIATDANYPLV